MRPTTITIRETNDDEPGPEVDDPREQPEPVEWSEVAPPPLARPAALPRVLRYR